MTFVNLNNGSLGHKRTVPQLINTCALEIKILLILYFIAKFFILLQISCSDLIVVINIFTSVMVYALQENM